MNSFALYRLPHAATCVSVEGQADELQSCAQLNARSGFVVAPFEVRSGQPIVVIRPDCVSTSPDYDELEQRTAGCMGTISVKGCSRDDYFIDFSNFHAQLQQGTFRKIVLARCADEQLPQGVSPVTLFRRACERYPRLFISLVYTPQSGMWLMATPEILLDGKLGGVWRTIALAGTMQLRDEQLYGEGETVSWAIKDIQEQRYVSTYIAECLEQFTADFREEGPRTVRAANLVHLRSDFTFTLPSPDCIGELLQLLHPTPAVCGLPKRDTFRFIVRNERTPRRYYSGFMGPLQLTLSEDSEAETHLYVSLRCMNIEAGCCHLYAGGGLLCGSVEEQEWQETEAKLGTMRYIINNV